MIVRPSVVLVDPNADLQAAVDATPEGGSLVLKAGTYTAPTGGLLISRGIDLGGYGMETFIRPYAQGQPVIRFLSGNTYTNIINNVRLHDFVIDGGKPNPTGDVTGAVADGYGIKIVADTAQLLSRVSLERLYIENCGNDGIYIASTPVGGAGASCLIDLQINGCTAYNNWGKGLNINGGVTMLTMRGNLWAYNLNEGSSIVGVDCGVWGDYYEGNCMGADSTNIMSAASGRGQAHFQSCNGTLRIRSFESFNLGPGTQIGLGLVNFSGEVTGIRFLNMLNNAVSADDPISIFLDNTGSAVGRAVFIGPNAHENHLDSGSAIVVAGTGAYNPTGVVVMPQFDISNSGTINVPRNGGSPPLYSAY